MKNRWTLHVEDFGSIRSADIEVAPMMLFVGPNNTGKSYLASLLWGILEMGLVFRTDIPNQKSYRKCEELMIEYLKNKKIIVEKDLIDAILVWFNENLDFFKNAVIKNFLSYDESKIGKLSITNFQYSTPLSIEWIERNENEGIIKPSITLLHDFIGKVPDNLIYFLYIHGVIPNREYLYSIFKLIAFKLIISESLYNHSLIYLPASRTGFMLSYKPLAADLMNLWGLDKQEVQTTFALPTIRFLQKLIKAEMSSDTPFADIAESLEKQILKGKIIQNSQTQSFYYAPESNPTNLMPLHTTSSLVTELAPLIIFLKDRLSKFNLLVFEEPESHLHLEAQRILAKHLVKLVNRGVPVWMTTHSDTMFQQFNNLLASNEKRIQKLKNLSYQEDELIKPEDIKAYQFNIAEDGKTDVVPLEQTEDGLIAPTFNKTIIELSEEAIHLEKDSEDVD